MNIQFEGFLISFLFAIPVSIIWVYLIDYSKRKLEEDERNRKD